MLLAAAVLILAGTSVPAPMVASPKLGRPAICWVPNAPARAHWHSFDTESGRAQE
jgi:hypothetical protein